MSDLGRAEDGTAEHRTSARLDGTPTVVLEVIRQSGASTVAVIDGVKAALERVQQELPPDVRLLVIRDQSRYIRAALHEINVHLIAGTILASLVVLAVHAELAGHDHRLRRDPDVGHRDVRGHVVARTSRSTA